ncbi:hypothetical protein HN643_04460 [Candidatus Falkowbacteria bacterium]|jgi:hypothetical protein|nr:hypothetical protein [Candidatus Falkowbacteria bacterium]MBT6574531.1 hypothetical protein [Candidatus Falkowbacteria bacterium]MBT7500892.1 hypothetical protein [Candidatus Falkowbacteria bacterium]
MRKVFISFVVFTTICWTVGIGAFIPVASAATLSAGDLIKASGAAVYFYAADGGRYTFPTQSTYMTWYNDFSSVVPVTDDELAAIDLVGNVMVRPGTKLVKITTVPKVYAVGPEGALYWVETEAAAKALYGDNWSSMVIDVPDSLFTNYTDSGVALDGTVYPEGQLVSPADSADTYYVNADGSWSLVADEAAFNANNWDWDFVLETSLAMGTAGADVTAMVDSYIDVSQGGGGGSGTVVASGDLSVSLNSGNPEGQYVSKGAQNVLFAKFDLGVSGTVEIDKIVLQRAGLGYDADLGTIRLYDGATQVGNDQSLNTTTHKVTFKNLNWTVSADTVLSVKANIDAAPSGTNDYLSIVEIDANDAGVTGLPVIGNAMQFSNLSVGVLNVASVAGSAAVISGEAEVELGCWNFNTSSIEGFHIDSLMLTNIGSASSGDALNFYLKQSSNKIEGSDTAAMASNGTVTFDLSADPYFIDLSKTKKICAYGDIAAGITVSKTLIFQVAETGDVAARGDSSAGQVLITTGGTTFSAQSAKTNTIGQGSATLTQDSAYAPAAGTLVKGVEGNKLGAYKLTAGSNEGVRMTRLRVIMAGTAGIANTDFANWMLYKIVDGAEVEIPVSGSVSSFTVSFEDTTDGLLDVAKSDNETVVVRADVSTSFAGTETGVHAYVGDNGTTNTLVRIKGLDSDEYVTSGVTLSGVATGNAQTFEGAANGSLVVSKAASSPGATNVSKGAKNVHFTDINLYSTGEDMLVSELVITGTASTDLSDDVDTVYLTDANGDQIGSTCSAFTSGTTTGECSFSFELDVPKEENVVVSVYGNVLDGATSTDTVRLDMDTAADDITSTGAFSAADITETGTAVGNVITVTAPTITAYMGTAPVDGTYVQNANDVTLGKLIMQAGTAEEIKVTSIQISADDLTGITGASVASATLTSFKLIDEDTGAQYGSNLNLTDGDTAEDSATFSGIDNLTIPAGGTVRINVVADITGSTAGPWFVGVETPTADIVATGLASGYSLIAADINGGVTTAIESSEATVASVGTLKITAASGRASAAQYVAGATGNSLMTYKLQSTNEEIDVTELYIATTGATARQDVYRVKLYLDGVLIGDAGGYSLDTGGDAKVVLTAGTLVVPKSPEYKNLDIKVDFSAKADLSDGATLEIGLGDVNGVDAEWGAAGVAAAGSYKMVATGVSSGTVLTETTIDSLGTNAGNVIASYVNYLYDGLLVVSKNTASPSGVTTGSDDSELLAIDLYANGDEITIGVLEFCYTGVAGNADPTGDLILKSSDLQTTYGTITPAEFVLYWDDIGGDGADVDLSVPLKTGVDAGEQCFSFGDTDYTDVVPYVTGDNEDSIGEYMEELSSEVKVPQGETITLKLIGDTTGFTTNDSLKITVRENSTAVNAVTAAGVIWENSGGTDVDNALTKNLPVAGGTLTY